ncbi:MAG: hypothetical protein GX946_08145 [Oligosphaeraceae bacterium]|nr:hypothetical protein [Oligosphaeraceae bacterium]
MYLRHVSLILLTLLFFCLFSACLDNKVFQPRYEFLAAYEHPPQFWLEYHPYPPAQSASSQPKVRAIPQNEGWTDLRMQRELKQFQAAGISTLLLHVSPEMLAAEHFAERLQKFHTFATELAPGLSIAPVLCPTSEGMRLSVQNTMQYVERLGFLQLPASLKLQGKPVLFFGGQIELIDDYKGARSYASLPAFLDDRQNRADSVNIAEPLTSAQGNDLALRRYQGVFFARQLQLAYDHKARIIYLKSWNNYEAGNFLEPNSLDRELMLQVLELAQNALPQADER